MTAVQAVTPAAAEYTFQATKPAAAVIGVVPDGTFILLLTMNGVDEACTEIASVPVATTNLLLSISPRSNAVALRIACVIFPEK